MKTFTATNPDFDLELRVERSHQVLSELLDPARKSVAGNLELDALAFGSKATESELNLDYGIRPNYQPEPAPEPGSKNRRAWAVSAGALVLVLGIGLVFNFSKEATPGVVAEQAATPTPGAAPRNVEIPEDLKHLPEDWAREVVFYRSAADDILKIKRKISQGDAATAKTYAAVIARHGEVDKLSQVQLLRMSFQVVSGQDQAVRVSDSFRNILLPFLRDFGRATN